MEREIIKSAVASVPTSEIGEIQRDNEIWEEYDGGAKLMVTRHTLATPNRDEIISLSVSGEPNERQRVLQEFIEIYGLPIELTYSVEPDAVEYQTWLAPKLTK